MICKFSTGLRNAMLATDSLLSLLEGGNITIYKGTPPDTADDAVTSRTGDILVTIENTVFDQTPVLGSVVKDAGETWSAEIAATGTATWFRHTASDDTGVESESEARIQGDVGVAGAALNLSSINLIDGATQTLDYYTITLPTA